MFFLRFRNKPGQQYQSWAFITGTGNRATHTSTAVNKEGLVNLDIRIAMNGEAKVQISPAAPVPAPSVPSQIPDLRPERAHAHSVRYEIFEPKDMLDGIPDDDDDVLAVEGRFWDSGVDVVYNDVGYWEYYTEPPDVEDWSHFPDLKHGGDPALFEQVTKDFNRIMDLITARPIVVETSELFAPEKIVCEASQLMSLGVGGHAASAFLVGLILGFLLAPYSQKKSFWGFVRKRKKNRRHILF